MPSTTIADGTWRVASANLANELPQLIEDASKDGFEIRRVMYRLDEWEPAPRRLAVAGRWIHLGGYRTQPAGSVTIVDPSDTRRRNLLMSAVGNERTPQTWADDGGTSETPQQALAAR